MVSNGGIRIAFVPHTVREVVTAAEVDAYYRLSTVAFGIIDSLKVGACRRVECDVAGDVDLPPAIENGSASQASPSL